MTIDILLKHNFLYDSSMMGHDYLPYFARRNDVITNDEPIQFGEVTKLVELPISSSLDDFPPFRVSPTAQFLAARFGKCAVGARELIHYPHNGLGPADLHLPSLRHRARPPEGRCEGLSQSCRQVTTITESPCLALTDCIYFPNIE